MLILILMRETSIHFWSPTERSSQLHLSRSSRAGARFVVSCLSKCALLFRMPSMSKNAKSGNSIFSSGVVKSGIQNRLRRNVSITLDLLRRCTFKQTSTSEWKLFI